MTLKINSLAPDFKAKTTIGDISFHEWLGDSWGVLFSHPKDFTPVCTTELGSLASLQSEFEKRNVKVIGLSVDPVDDHNAWLKDIKDVTGHSPQYPIIADTESPFGTFACDSCDVSNVRGWRVERDELSDERRPSCVEF